jgi:hypothetical protein
MIIGQIFRSRRQTAAYTSLTSPLSSSYRHPAVSAPSASSTATVYPRHKCARIILTNFYSSSSSDDFDWRIFRKLLATDAEDAERFIQISWKAKNESLKAKDNTILFSNELVRNLRESLMKSEIRLCQIDGLMNIRGIFEFLLTICVAENSSMKRIKTVADKIEFIKGLKYIPEEAAYTKELLAASSENKLCLHKYYKTLSHKIHGLPWEENSLRLYITSMCENERLLSTRIANLLEIKVKEVEESKLE